MHHNLHCSPAVAESAAGSGASPFIRPVTSADNLAPNVWRRAPPALQPPSSIFQGATKRKSNFLPVHCPMSYAHKCMCSKVVAGKIYRLRFFAWLRYFDRTNELQWCETHRARLQPHTHLQNTSCQSLQLAVTDFQRCTEEPSVPQADALAITHSHPSPASATAASVPVAASGCLVDAGLMLGHSCRVGWGPNGTLYIPGAAAKLCVVLYAH